MFLSTASIAEIMLICLWGATPSSETSKYFKQLLNLAEFKNADIFDHVADTDSSAYSNTLSRDSHRPGLHAAVDGTGASFADEGSEISNFNVAEHRGNAKKVLGPRELKTFNSVALIEPGGGNCVSGVKEVTRKEKEL